MILVHRHDHLAVTTGAEPIPVPGRHGHTPLGVERDFGGPSKHDVTDKPGIALLARNPGWLPISSHFFPLFDTIGPAFFRVNRSLRFRLFYRDLTAISWPEKGELWQALTQQNQRLKVRSSTLSKIAVGNRRQPGRKPGHGGDLRKSRASFCGRAVSRALKH